jgi:hypothetical protein
MTHYYTNAGIALDDAIRRRDLDKAYACVIAYERGSGWLLYDPTLPPSGAEPEIIVISIHPQIIILPLSQSGTETLTSLGRSRAPVPEEGVTWHNIT